MTPFKFDGYLGNGIYTYSKTFVASSAFQTAVRKYGPAVFTRTTLAIFDREEDAYKMEELVVTEDFIKRADVYNMVVGGKRSNYSSFYRPVRQYDIGGNLLKTFDSIHEAAIQVATEPWFIIKACSTQNITCKGYFWRYPDKTSALIIDTNFVSHDINKAVPVVQYSKTGYRIKEWGSIVEAAKALHCDKSSISGVCKGYRGRKLCGGYQWRYLTDKLETIDAVDTSGGIPKKVVKLSSEGILLDSYESIQEAEFKTGISKASIHKGLKNGKTICGFKWEYV